MLAQRKKEEAEADAAKQKAEPKSVKKELKSDK